MRAVAHAVLARDLERVPGSGPDPWPALNFVLHPRPSSLPARPARMPPDRAERRPTASARRTPGAPPEFLAPMEAPGPN